MIKPVQQSVEQPNGSGVAVDCQSVPDILEREQDALIAPVK
jgi:hypothetical protein